jgi:hypothetical protein
MKEAIVKQYPISPNAVVAYEVPVGNCRVDVALFEKHTSTAFEIKTKGDDLSRLSSQVSEYKKFFEIVWIVLDHIDKTKIEEVKRKYTGTNGIYIAALTHEGDFIEIDGYGYSRPDADYIYKNLYVWQLRLFDDEYRESNQDRDEFRKDIFNNKDEVIEFWRDINRIIYKKRSNKIRKEVLS